MNEQETTEDIIAEARDKYTVHECNQCAWRKCCSEGFGSEKCGKFRESIFLKLGIEDGYFTQLLDRLEAAHKRELSKNVSKNEANFGQLGDAAKLREALVRFTEWYKITSIRTACLRTIAETARAALSAPSRNCDVLKLKEGRPGDMADQVWRAYKNSHMGSYLDVCDLLRCIGWLLAPATEKEGGNDEQK